MQYGFDIPRALIHCRKNEDAIAYGKINYGTSLAHHGILGQKWGVRRFQNEDGSYTKAGEMRYGIGRGNKNDKSPSNNERAYNVRSKEEMKAEDARIAGKLEKAKADYQNYKSAYDGVSAANNGNKKNIDVIKANVRQKNAKQQVEDLKLLQRINKQSRVSKHRQKLEEKYIAKGMTPDEAKVAAYKRERTEKIVAIAALTTASVAGSWLYRNHMANFDKILPAGTTFQNLSTNPNKGVRDAFYASYDARDKQKYLGLFGGGFLQSGKKNPLVHELSAEAMSKMRIAGRKVGIETANELIQNDPVYKERLKDLLDDFGAGKNKKLGVLVDMALLPGFGNIQDVVYKNKPLDKAGYNVINTLLVDHSPNSQELGERFISALKKKGYDGTLDLNDMFNTLYKAKSPVVIFNGESKLGNIARGSLAAAPLKTKNKLETALIVGKQLGKVAAPAIAAGSIAKNIPSRISDERNKKRIVEAYKKEHPNTKLSDSEILKMR